ncbi:glutathione S-transferase 1-like [Styela clava]|uniref:glutathione S-transferase 1-like n=1 Tax=Styela clava TaxID=7725 RepID=UPI00193ABE95|nr:glutathione S-transferase 1-like [Styela clava]
MGCNSSKQVQIQQANTSSGEFQTVRGDLYVAWISTPCRATFMTCAALKIKPNFKPLDLFKGETRTPEFQAINPFHTLPTYVDGDFKLWESRAIMAYLVTTFGGPDHALYPRDPKKRAAIDNVLNADHSTFYKTVSEWIFPQILKKEPGSDEKLAEVKKAFKILNDYYLKDRQYVTGNQMSIADFSVLATVTFTELVDLDLSEFPNIVDWCNRMKKLPYMEKCNEGLYEGKKRLAESSN